MSHLYFKYTSRFINLKDSFTNMFPTSMKTTIIKKISIEATIELISLSWCFLYYSPGKVNSKLKDRIISSTKQILVCTFWTTCLKKGFINIKINQSQICTMQQYTEYIYQHAECMWYFIKKRVQNRLFNPPSHHYFHSILPFCYYKHFHPDPTGLNPSNFTTKQRICKCMLIYNAILEA